MTIRPGHGADLPSLYEICHKTGRNGQDASAVISDRQLLGQYFAAPYLVRDPDWCWIAQDAEGVAGYLVTTPDTRAFTAWMNTVWLPGVREACPPPVKTPASETEAWIRQLFVSPAGFPDFVDNYPAHLHIDLLPRAQGLGLGGRMLKLFQERLRAEGVPGFHLGVGEGNTKAQGFYQRQGFQVIRHDPGVLFLGLRF